MSWILLTQIPPLTAYSAATRHPTTGPPLSTSDLGEVSEAKYGPLVCLILIPPDLPGVSPYYDLDGSRGHTYLLQSSSPKAEFFAREVIGYMVRQLSYWRFPAETE